MYCSPRLAMYGVTLRGPASRLPASLSSPSSAAWAARALAAMPVWLDTPVAVTTMRSEGAALRMAWATGVALAGDAGFATGAGAGAGFGAGLAATGAFTGAGLAEDLAATGLAAGFFAVNLGFSALLGFAGFAAARLVGIVGRSRPFFGRGPVCRTRDYTGQLLRVQRSEKDGLSMIFRREIRVVPPLAEPSSRVYGAPRSPSCKYRPER